MHYSPLFPISTEKNPLKKPHFSSLFPFGFHWLTKDSGIFSLYAPSAKEMVLRLYSPYDLTTSFYTAKLTPQNDIASCELSDLPSTFAYSWQIIREQIQSPEFADPWNPLLAGVHPWKGELQDNRSLVCQSHFSLPSNVMQQPLPSDLRIYECHVRAASQRHFDPSTAGFYSGLIPLLNHIENLGFNAIELLPLQEFAEKKIGSNEPNLVNYWGYMPLHPQCLMRAYSSNAQSLEAEKEFALFLRHAHERDIRVILDLVFNHLDKNCPMAHCLGQDLWLKDTQGSAVDYTGCGNTVNCQHPVVYEWIRFQLYYWVYHLGVDGFRFDLACALYRQTSGQCVFEGSLLYRLKQDPWLKNRIWINEPWDAAGAWDLGQTAKYGFYEWNDRYRDDARHYIHFGQRKDIAATRLCGSTDLFPSGTPGGSIQYITSHDGFCLRDLVTYNEKHNLLNGENNRDGHQNNISFNYGLEGPSYDEDIERVRLQQICNFITFLAVSQGPIMLLSGDEYGHTREGNNNPWCQDNELNALDWTLIKKGSPILLHLKKLMHWRKTFPLFNSKNNWNREHILWHGLKLDKPQWEYPDGPLFLEMRWNDLKACILFNPTEQTQTFELPIQNPSKPQAWYTVASSALFSLDKSSVTLLGKSSLVLSNYLLTKLK